MTNTTNGTNGIAADVEERNALTKKVLGFEKDARMRFTKFDPKADAQDAQLIARYEEIGVEITAYETKFGKPFPLLSAAEYRSELLNVWDGFIDAWQVASFEDFEKVDVTQPDQDPAFLTDYGRLRAGIDQYHQLYGRQFRPDGDVVGNGTNGVNWDPLGGIKETPTRWERFVAWRKGFSLPSRRSLILGGSAAAVMALVGTGFRYGPGIVDFFRSGSPTEEVADAPSANNKKAEKKAAVKVASIAPAAKASAPAATAKAAPALVAAAKPDAPAPETPPIAGLPGGPMPGLPAATVPTPPAKAAPAAKPPVLAGAEPSVQRAGATEPKAVAKQKAQRPKKLDRGVDEPAVNLATATAKLSTKAVSYRVQRGLPATELPGCTERGVHYPNTLEFANGCAHVVVWKTRDEGGVESISEQRPLLPSGEPWPLGPQAHFRWKSCESRQLLAVGHKLAPIHWICLNPGEFERWKTAQR